ncbi:hypothetical protein Tco_1310929 [Tanacetum coccineum]
MDLKTQLETVVKNTQASIQNLETRFDGLAEKQPGRPSKNNSKPYQPPQAQNGHVNVVFTQSGKSYVSPVNPDNQQNDIETPVNFDSDDTSTKASKSY